MAAMDKDGPVLACTKAVGWGWYYLCSVLDDYSRYMKAWRLSKTMSSYNFTGKVEILTFTIDMWDAVGQTPPKLLPRSAP